MARADWRRPTCFALPEGCRRIRVTVAYDGSGFSGWQRQKGARSVQEEIETALRKMLKVPVVVHGSGRTDAGVHALGQVAQLRFFLSRSTIFCRMRSGCGMAGKWMRPSTPGSPRFRANIGISASRNGISPPSTETGRVGSGNSPPWSY